MRKPQGIVRLRYIQWLSHKYLIQISQNMSSCRLAIGSCLIIFAFIPTCGSQTNSTTGVDNPIKMQSHHRMVATSSEELSSQESQVRQTHSQSQTKGRAQTVFRFEAGSVIRTSTGQTQFGSRLIESLRP